MQRISGLNHITFSVSDLSRSIAFYRDVLGCLLRAQWDEGAYLEAGDLWLCLSLQKRARTSPNPDYTHIAFSVDENDYPSLSERLARECSTWSQNKSEGASLYFLDPDGHKLEIHVGSLETRLRHYRENPPKGMKLFNS